VLKLFFFVIFVSSVVNTSPQEIKHRSPPSLNAFAIKVPSFIAKAGFLDRMISTVSTLAVTAFSHDSGPIRPIFRLCLLPGDGVDQLEQSPKWTAV